MKNSFIPYAKQSINQADLEAMQSALQGDIITRGPLVEQFEQAIAKYCGASYAVAFNSGSSALAAACFAARLTAADRVLTTPNTFAATIAAPLHQGATPVLIDIDRNTGNMDTSLLFANFDFASTRGRLVLMPVHFSGIPVDMERVSREIRHFDAVIIEDAAHALGSSFPNGQKVGSCAWSDMTMFSFHPAKQITTGEGGMVTTNNSELDYRLRLYRNNGVVRDLDHLKGSPAPGYYEVQEISGNYNFTEFQAALGLSQLQRLEQFITKRRELVSLYRQELQEVPHLKMLTDAFDHQTSFHLFVVQIDFFAYRITREAVMEKMKSEGIGTQVHYIPLYRHPFFHRLTSTDLKEFFPQMEEYYAQTLTLPLYPDLTGEEVKKICHLLKASLNEKKSW